MKKKLNLIGLCLSAIIMFCSSAFSQDMSMEEIQKELEGLKTRINRLEQELKNKDQEIKELKKQSAEQAEKIESGAEKGAGLCADVLDRVTISGLVEAGGAYKSTDFNTRSRGDDTSDINLTTVEIGVGVAVNDWVNLETVFLYEDPFDDDDSSVDLDVGTITFGNSERSPFYLSLGKMYVPFGALLTHLPDDPAVDQPMTLMMGETSEKALLTGFEKSGISFAGYAYNGDMDEAGDNQIEGYGFDFNYSLSDRDPFELLIGASYISNIADSDGLTDYLHSEGVDTLNDYIEGIAAYMHLGIGQFFFDAEYMTALDEFDPAEIALRDGRGAEPAVWNMETGYNWNWGKNLEIVLKYAGSDETEALGFPEDRYGIGFNQEIYDGVTGSVAVYKDDYHRGDVDNRDDGYTAVGQIAVEF